MAAEIQQLLRRTRKRKLEIVEKDAQQLFEAASLGTELTSWERERAPSPSSWNPADQSTPVVGDGGDQTRDVVRDADEPKGLPQCDVASPHVLDVPLQQPQLQPQRLDVVEQQRQPCSSSTSAASGPPVESRPHKSRR